jgi:hypothetical protein
MTQQVFVEKHQYLVDPTGHKTHIVLPLEEYEELIHQLLDARDVARLPELRAGIENAERITIEELRTQFGLEP